MTVRDHGILYMKYQANTRKHRQKLTRGDYEYIYGINGHQRPAAASGSKIEKEKKNTASGILATLDSGDNHRTTKGVWPLHGLGALNKRSAGDDASCHAGSFFIFVPRRRG